MKAMTIQLFVWIQTFDYWFVFFFNKLKLNLTEEDTHAHALKSICLAIMIEQWLFISMDRLAERKKMKGKVIRSRWYRHRRWRDCHRSESVWSLVVVCNSSIEYCRPFVILSTRAHTHNLQKPNDTQAVVLHHTPKMPFQFLRERVHHLSNFRCVCWFDVVCWAQHAANY